MIKRKSEVCCQRYLSKQSKIEPQLESFQMMLPGNKIYANIKGAKDFLWSGGIEKAEFNLKDPKEINSFISEAKINGCR